MRITGGLYKGRRLRCPATGRNSSQNIRPVMAKMRESIFSMLYSRFGGVEGLRFLDLFGGSGLMSVEAASRGAAYLEIVESDLRKKNVLEWNLGIAEVPWKLHMLSVQDFLAQRSESPAFDVVYIDPPFSMENKEQILEALACSGLCRGLVLLHRPTAEAKRTKRSSGSLMLEHCKYYGGSALCCYGVSRIVGNTE